MKKIKYLSLALAATCLTACSLDETNYSTIDTSIAYASAENYNGIIDACYDNVYYMYGKQDGIGPMEMGTDLWKINSLTGSEGDLVNYNTNLTTNTGVLKTLWNALYGIVGYCNTALYFQNQGNFRPEEVAAKAAEARFLRAFAYFHIVEQWGGVVCDTISFAQSGVAAEYAHRSDEETFYNLIISDLNIAVRDLPVVSDRGRASKKAAIAMLAKAYLQRTRLYAEGSAECKANADSSFKYATMLCDNAAQYNCGLYASTNKQSGSARVWDDDNNKDNMEFIFIQSIDHVNGYNPEWWNRGRTSQYYQMPSTQSQNFGVNGSGLRYGRANACRFSPTQYLLQQCFDPKLQKSETRTELINLAADPNSRTADTRFEQTFYYKYFALGQTTPSRSILGQYKKDTLNYFTKRSERQIKGSMITGAKMEEQFPGLNYYAGSTLSGENFEREDIDDALAVYTPNWDLDTLKNRRNKRLAVGPNEYFNQTPEKFGQQAEYSYFRNLFPSLRKQRAFKYVYSNQYCMMDQPIIRLTDIYLIAAEASITAGKPAEGLKYLNEVRKHAALSTDAAEMTVGMESMTIDYILKERARELCGEQWRWYDLKRTRNLTSAYLTQKGMNPFMSIEDEKHQVRPIPQQFLDQIANPDEFGTNGY